MVYRHPHAVEDDVLLVDFDALQQGQMALKFTPTNSHIPAVPNLGNAGDAPMEILATWWGAICLASAQNLALLFPGSKVERVGGLLTPRTVTFFHRYECCTRHRGARPPVSGL